MTVSDVMNADVLTITPETPIEDARTLMRQRKIHHLVVGRGAQPVGVVSAHDLSRRQSRRRQPKTVADIMSRHLIAIESRASLLGRLGDADQRRRRADDGTAIHHRVGHRHRSRANGVW